MAALRQLSQNYWRFVKLLRHRDYVKQLLPPVEAVRPNTRLNAKKVGQSHHRAVRDVVTLVLLVVVRVDGQLYVVLCVVWPVLVRQGPLPLLL